VALDLLYSSIQVKQLDGNNYFTPGALIEHRRSLLSLRRRFSAYVLILFSLASVLPGHSAMSVSHQGGVALIMPTGSVVYSRTAIKKRLIDERNGKLKDTILQNTIARVSFPNKASRYRPRKLSIAGHEIIRIGDISGRQICLPSKKTTGTVDDFKSRTLSAKSLDGCQ